MLDEKEYLKPIIDNVKPLVYFHKCIQYGKNFLYFGDIMRNIFEIKEMHVTKINESNYVTYFMIDLYQCHLHERYYYSLLFNERSVWYKKKRVYVKQNDWKLGAQ